MTCGSWRPYTRFQGDINDPRVQDPSNGGTAPQNYVNVSSSCIDQSYPSIYYHLYQHPTDASKDVIMFRWRVEQIANNYATGPSAGNYGATDPWSSGLWTVLFDVDGDGYRDLAAHLNGSSGDPSHPIDLIAGIWGKLPTQSIDYLTDPNVKLIAHNPTAFVSGSTILNFQSSLTPTTTWPPGATANSWDYGTTRAKLVYTNACNEYFVDYQIPVRMLDASSSGPNPSLSGPKITRNTPISMLFCTANSLNNPFQKDCSLNRSFIGDASKPGPFGDYLSFSKEQPYSQPIVSSVTATGPNTCPGTYSLTAKVQDTLYVDAAGVIKPSVKSVKFVYWYDKDGDGTTAGDIGSTWTHAVDGTLKAGTLNTWTANWDATSLLKGKYLIGVQALDDKTLHDDGVPDAPVDNRTFSYLMGSADAATQAQIYINPWSYDGTTKTWVSGGPGDWVAGQQAAFPPHSPTPIEGAGENWYGNPDVTGLQTALIGVAINACGVAPTIAKTATPSTATTGQEVTFGITATNPANNPSAVSLTQLQDILPAGFSYKAGSTSGVFGTNDPSINAQTVTWTGNATLAPGASATLNFIAIAPNVTGTYSNVATALTSFGDIVSAPLQIGVGAPRLTVAKTASPLSAVPGATITYTLRYANDSPVNVTGVTLSDPLPAGITYVPSSCSGGCAYDAGSRTLTWSAGSLASGEGPYTVTFQATVDSPYAGSASNQNTVTISSSETAPATASAALFIDTPRPQLTLKKTASAIVVAPGASVTFTLAYANTGNASATNVVLSDPLPSGFSFVSCAGGCSNPGVGSNGTVSWNLGTLAAGASGSVTVVAQASNPYIGTSNPATNTASISATEVGTPVTDRADLGVSQSGQTCTKYYLTNGTTNVGTLTGTQVGWPAINLANPQRTLTTVTPAGSTTIQRYIPSNGNPVPEIEVARFYQEPVSPQLIAFDGSSTFSGFIYYTKSNALGGAANSNLTLYVRAYDFDPATGTQVLLGTATYTDNGAPTPPVDLSNVTPTNSIQKGHRLLIVVSVVMAQNKDTTMELTVNSAQSYTEICAPPPANLVLEKSVNTSSVNVTGSGRTLTYTLNYANTSSATAATTASIIDTLPASGVTYSSCSVAGSTHFNRCSHAAGTVTFDSVGGATIPASGTGSVTVTVTVADDLAGISSLTNSAQIQSTQTALAPVAGATATTTVSGATSNPAGTPNVVLAKSADKTLLVPGDTVTYTLTALNAGDKTATTVVVSDDFPDQAYFSYGTCSTGTGSCSQAGGILNWNIGSLSPGQSAMLAFTMVVGANPPTGITGLDNTATATYAGGGGGTATSGSTTVSISTNPNLGLSKSAADLNGGSLVPGDTLRYMLTVTNTGSGSATGVVVSDPIPVYTSFKGSITATSGSGIFDAINNRIVFTIGTLAAGASATLAFDVTIASPLPSGSTAVPNTASASASNAASRTANATSTATASPVMNLSKTGPASVAYPAATLSANASASTLLFVSSAAPFSVNQYISVGGAIRRITAIAGNSMTVDVAVTATAGAPVVAAATFQLTYQNTGDADASGVVVSDVLPPGWVFVAASPTASVAPAIGNNGTVSWTIGSVAAGGSATLQLVALPTATGSTTNTVTLTDTTHCTGGTPPVSCSSSLPTTVGGLAVSKTTGTPVVSAGGTATWTLTVTNTLASPVTGVAVTDVLPAGFAYAATGAISAPGATRTTTVDPSVGDSQPTWSTWTLPANGTLTITFSASIGAGVGAATYQNDVTAANTSGAGVADFDPLATTTEDVTVLAAGTGIVDGTVYRDNNGNGSFDASVDTPLIGVAVTIVDGTGTAYITYTNADGHFSRVVAAGNAVVDVADPAGTVLTTGSTDPTTVTVPGGGRVTDDTGFVDAAPNQGNVAGTVFTDANGNGSQDSGEPGRIGVTVELLDSGGSVVRSTLSDVTGGYSFASVPPGTYSVRIIVPAGLGATSANPVPGMTILANQTVTASFGLSAQPDLAIAKSHVGNFTQGQTGASYSLTVSNIGTAASSGLVTVTDTLPAGLTATALTGTGWACVLATLTCTRNDALPAGSSYPVITMIVNVAANAAASVTNSATVSGGGDGNNANNSTADPTTIDGVTDVTTTITAPPSVASGSIVNLLVGFSNQGGATASNVTYLVTLPAGLAGISCTGATCNYASGTGLVTVTGLPTMLSAGQNLNMVLSYSAPGSGPLSAVSQIDTSSSESNTGNNSASAITAITVNVADVAVSLVAPATANPAATVFIPISIINLGASTATGVTYALALPAGLAGVACSGATCSYDAGTGTVTLGGLPASLNPGQSVAYTLTYTAPGSGSVTVTAGTDAHNDSNSTNNSASDSTMVSTSTNADVLTTVSAPGSITAGATVDVPFIFQNNGPAAAANVSYNLTVPAGLTGVSCSAGVTCNYAGTTIAVTGLPVSLNPGESSGFTLSYTAPGSGSVTVTSTIATTTAETNIGNNSASATTLIGAQPDLTLAKSHVGNFIQGQTAASYSLTVSNIGTAASSGLVTVTDTLPAGLTAIALTGTGWACVLASLTCTRNDALPAGSSYPVITATVNVAANAAASVTNSATVSGGGDGNNANNSTSDATTINPLVTTDVAATVLAPANATTGGTINVTVGFANLSGTAAAGITYSLTLNNGLSGVVCSGSGITCTYNSSTGVTTLFGLPANLAGAQSIAFALNYTAPAAGTTVIVTVSISTTAADSNTANNSASGSTVVGAAPPVNPPATTTPIPTLSQWGLIMLSGLLGLLAHGIMRRRSA